VSQNEWIRSLEEAELVSRTRGRDLGAKTALLLVGFALGFGVRGASLLWHLLLSWLP